MHKQNQEQTVFFMRILKAEKNYEQFIMINIGTFVLSGNR